MCLYMYYVCCTAWKMESSIHPSVLYFLKNWLNHKPFNLNRKTPTFPFAFHMYFVLRNVFQTLRAAILLYFLLKF